MTGIKYKAINDYFGDLFRIFCVLYFLWVMPKFATWGKGLGPKVYTWKEEDTLSELEWTQTNFSKKIVTISEFSSTSAPKRRNFSALLAILSPTFMDEIRTDMPMPGRPSLPTATANKKDDASLHMKCSNDFNLSSLISLTNK